MSTSSQQEVCSDSSAASAWIRLSQFTFTLRITEQWRSQRSTELAGGQCVIFFSLVVKMTSATVPFLQSLHNSKRSKVVFFFLLVETKVLMLKERNVFAFCVRGAVAGCPALLPGCHPFPFRSLCMGPNTVWLRLTPPPKDSHSVLTACTKVPLYNMCVTKINKHSPSLAVSAPKEKVMQSPPVVPRCPPVLSLPASLTPAPHRKPAPPLPLPLTGSRVVPVCSEGRGDINCGSSVYLLSFYFNLQLPGWWPGS